MEYSSESLAVRNLGRLENQWHFTNDVVSSHVFLLFYISGLHKLGGLEVNSSATQFFMYIPIIMRGNTFLLNCEFKRWLWLRLYVSNALFCLGGDGIFAEYEKHY